MKAGAIHLLITLTLGCFLTAALCGNSIAGEKELTPEEIVAAHLKSIGPPELMTGVRNRGMSGTTSVEFFQGGFGTLSGQCIVVSSGPKLSIILRYGARDYPREYFTYDGTDVEVATISPGQRSPLGDFIFRYKGVMEKGLLGGVWSMGWPLLDIEKRDPKLKYGGTENIDGRELHEINYTPKGGLGNMKIKLFFDPDTFHHVRTEYAVRVKGERALQAGKKVTEGVPNMDGSGITDRNAGILDPIGDSFYRLVETFDDFKEIKFKHFKGSETMSLTLPQTYTLEYSIEGQGSSFLARWKLIAGQWMQNGELDPSIFEAH